MGHILTHDVNAPLSIKLAPGVAAHPTGRHALRPQQHHHRRGEIITVAFALIKEKPVHGVGSIGRGRDGGVVAQRTQVILHSNRHVVRRAGVCRRNNLRRQSACAGGDGFRQLKVTLPHPRRISVTRRLEARNVSERDHCGDGVGRFGAQAFAGDDEGRFVKVGQRPARTTDEIMLNKARHTHTTERTAHHEQVIKPVSRQSEALECFTTFAQVAHRERFVGAKRGARLFGGVHAQNCPGLLADRVLPTLAGIFVKGNRPPVIVSGRTDLHHNGGAKQPCAPKGNPA